MGSVCSRARTADEGSPAGPTHVRWLRAGWSLLHVMSCKQDALAQTTPPPYKQLCRAAWGCVQNEPEPIATKPASDLPRGCTTEHHMHSVGQHRPQRPPQLQPARRGPGKCTGAAGRARVEGAARAGCGPGSRLPRRRPCAARAGCCCCSRVPAPPRAPARAHAGCAHGRLHARAPAGSRDAQRPGAGDRWAGADTAAAGRLDTGASLGRQAAEGQDGQAGRQGRQAGRTGQAAGRDEGTWQSAPDLPAAAGTHRRLAAQQALLE